jgi:hypothetical protein
MKKLVLFLFFLASHLLHAQAPNWQWTRTDGGAGVDRAYSSATDVNGNVFITGQFWSPTITLGSTTLTNAGNADFFIVKYDPSGNVLWAKSAGGTAAEIGYGITTDASGNVFVTGNFISSSITFGNTVLTNASASFQDIFVVKYDAAGNVLWAVREGGASNESGQSISADASGNVLVAGGFRSSTITFGSTTLTNAGNSDIFVVKYDATGNALWAASAGETSYDAATGVSTDANGNVLIAGAYESLFITFGNDTLTNAGGQDIFIAKYDASGNALWAKGAGGTDYDYAQSICTDANGNVFVTGGFYSTAISFGSTVLNNAGFDDIFFAKCDASGNAVWAKRAGGANPDRGYGICTDASGNVFATGVFNSAAASFGSTVLFGSGNGNVFVVGLDNPGNILWAKGSANASPNEARGISSTNGSAVITGSFGNIMMLDNDSLISTGSADIFTAKLNSVTGIAEENNYSALTVYPNPFSSAATIRSDRALKNATLVMYNSMGQKVNDISSITIDAGGTIELQRDLLPAGVYFIRVMEEDRIIAVGKMVVGDW